MVDHIIDNGKKLIYVDMPKYKKKETIYRGR